MSAFQDWLSRIHRAIWAPRLAHLPAWKMQAVRVVRLVLVLLRDVFDGPLTLWTMSLVYTTLLSMVPMLALSVTVLKAFGVHGRVELLLQTLLAPLGAQGQEVTNRIIGFIQNTNVGVLGSVGLALLIYTVISLMQKIEESFNSIWHVTQSRSLGTRFSRYLSALLVGPLVLFTAFGITAMALDSHVVQYIVAIEPLGGILLSAGRLVPYVLVIGAFTALYMFVPNARVRFGPAFLGGIVGGILWQSAGWTFALFVSSSTQYAAIYSSFAVLVLFLIWLYVSWLVLLFGADLSFYLQRQDYLYVMPGEPRLSNRMRERLALAVMERIASHFVRGLPPWTLPRLTEQLAVPMHAVDAVVGALLQGELLTQSNDDPPAYLPARDLAEIPIAKILAVVRNAGEARFLNPSSLPLSERVEALLADVDDRIYGATAGISVRTLVDVSDGADASTKETTGAA